MIDVKFHCRLFVFFIFFSLDTTNITATPTRELMPSTIHNTLSLLSPVLGLLPASVLLLVSGDDPLLIGTTGCVVVPAGSLPGADGSAPVSLPKEQTRGVVNRCYA